MNADLPRKHTPEHPRLRLLGLSILLRLVFLPPKSSSLSRVQGTRSRIVQQSQTLNLHTVRIRFENRGHNSPSHTVSSPTPDSLSSLLSS